MWSNVCGDGVRGKGRGAWAGSICVGGGEGGGGG